MYKTNPYDFDRAIRKTDAAKIEVGLGRLFSFSVVALVANKRMNIDKIDRTGTELPITAFLIIYLSNEAQPCQNSIGVPLEVD